MEVFLKLTKANGCLHENSELKPILLDNHGRKKVVKHLKKACRTRWLSLDASVNAARFDLEAFLQTLVLFEKKDATAHGVLRPMWCMFLGTIYILNDILPILSGLSR